MRQPACKSRATSDPCSPSRDGPPPGLRAGTSRADITDYEAGAVNDPLYAKALVLENGETAVAIVTVDAVALGEIGRIPNDYLANVRARLRADLEIEPGNVLINASHCHGVVCADVEDRTVRAVQEAWRNRAPVRVGVGRGHEDRIMENRRFRLKNGREADSRHAYSLPSDTEIAGIGPVDPEIGLFRLDRLDGTGTLAVVYNFACHPIQGVPNGGNTADLVGFASTVIEENLGHGVTALFLQGCAGDVNPVRYKDVDHPRDAQPLGTMLGLSVLRALRTIECRDTADLTVIRETLELPREDLRPHIRALEAEQAELLRSLHGTTLNLKTFLQLSVKHSLFPECPSGYAQAYLHEHAMGRDHLARLDTVNRANLEQYLNNIHTMEQLTRVQTNLALLRMHQAQNEAAGSETVEVEIMGVRIGDFVLLTFPGELSVQIGLDIKKESPRPFTFVTGCTNGYIYYAPTAEQLKNRGHAQEDSDCILAPEWQALFENRAHAILENL